MPADADEMMLVVAGGWHCLGGKAVDSSTSYRGKRAGKDGLSVKWMEQAEEQGCRQAMVDRGRGGAASCFCLGVWKGAPCAL